MGEIIRALITVALGVAFFAGVLCALYFVTTKLPQAVRERSQVMLFVGPALLLLLIGLVIPAVRTTLASFRDDTGAENWIWFGNFVDIFTEKNSRDTLTNTFLWVIVGTTLSTVFGLYIARLVDRMRGERTAKALIFLPTTIALAGAGIIWKFVYAGPPTKVGLLNAITGAIPGWPEQWGGDGQKLWLVDPWPLNTLLLIVILIWVQTGFATVVFSAAIKGVPDSLLEAARVDGATEREVFFKVVLPSIKATIITVVTTTVIAALKVFDIVKAATGGNFRTSTIANDVYDNYFIQGRDNYGSALAVILFVLVIPVVIVNQRSQRQAREMS